MSDREKFIEWYKTVPYFQPSDLCSCNGIFVDNRVRVMCDAYLAGRNAALDEVMALCAKELYWQFESDTARNAKNALMHSPDSAKWQKMMALIRGIK